MRKFPEEFYLSKENTTSVNGIFILIVFINHVQSYIRLPEIFHDFTLGIGQLMVAMFFFYSGYGVCESIHKKGMAYVRGIPRKRVGKVLSEFVPAVLFFALTDFFCGISFTPGQFFLSLFGWESLGNSNWYIFVILCLYGITCLAFMCGKHFRGTEGQKEWLAFFFVVLMTAMLFLFLHETKENWWYNTLTAYPLGMFFSLSKSRWKKILGNPAGYLSVFTLSLAVTLILKPVSQHASLHLVMTVSYCIFILCVTKKVPVYHPVLYWLGSHLFEIYILMRIPMIVLQRTGFGQYPALYTLFSFVATLLVAAGYHWLIQKFRFITSHRAISQKE